MTDNNSTNGRRILASLVAVLMLTSVLGPVGVASAQTVSFTQTVQSGDTTVAPGETFTVEATVDYSDVNSPAIDADIPDGWTVTAHTDDNGAYKSSEIQWVWLEGDTDGVSGTHTVTYTVQVPSDASPGEYTIAGEGSAVNPADSSFVSATDDLTVTVEDTGGDDPALDPIGNFENAPTDPDGDGVYEDVNGDGSVNVGDAQALFSNTDDPVIQNNVDAFDFNGDGLVNSGDAQALFANGLAAGDSDDTEA